MTTLNISLPESTKAFLEEQARDHGFRDVNEYVREVLRSLQKRKARAELETALHEGLDTPVIRMTEQNWQDLENELRRRSPDLDAE